MELKVERRYSIYFMEPNGSKKIFLDRNSFSLRCKVGYSNKKHSMDFIFDKNLLKGVVITSSYEEVRKKTIEELEREDEEDIIRFITIRSKTSITKLLKFIEPEKKRKVRTIKKRNIIVNNKSWQWGFKGFSKKIIKEEINDYNSDEINLLFQFLGLTI